MLLSKLEQDKERAEAAVQDLISLIYDGEDLFEDLHKQLIETRRMRNVFFDEQERIEVLNWRERCIQRLYAHYNAAPERSALLEQYISDREQAHGVSFWKQAFSAVQYVDEDFEVYFMEKGAF